MFYIRCDCPYILGLNYWHKNTEKIDLMYLNVYKVTCTYVSSNKELRPENIAKKIIELTFLHTSIQMAVNHLDIYSSRVPIYPNLYP